MEVRRYSPLLPSIVLTFAVVVLDVIMAFADGDWVSPLAVITAITAVSALVALAIPSLRNVRRSDFQITLFEVMVLTTCVAVLFAAGRFIPTDRDGGHVVFIIRQFLLSLVVLVAAAMTIAWEQQRRLRSAKAVEITLEPADGSETIDDIVSADDACPICSAPVAERGDCIGTSNSTLETSPGNIRWTTCRKCGVLLQGIDFYGGLPAAESANSSGKRAIRWEACITRKQPPDEVRMVVEQPDQ